MEAAQNSVEYYDRLAAYYHLFFDDLNASMAAEGSWLSGVLKARSVRRVLDASCGTGRQAVPLAARGFDVVGADPSAGMLAIASDAAARSGVSLSLVRASFVELPRHFGAEFDAVITMGNALCHADSSAAVERALQGVAACIRPGGVCIVGIKHYDKVRRERPRCMRRGLMRKEDDRIALFERWEYDDPALIVTAFLVRHAAGTRHVLTASVREYMLREGELRALAAGAGFHGVFSLDHAREAAYLLELSPSSRVKTDM